MTIQYKNETFDLTTTNITTVLTIPTSAVGIVKTIQAVQMTQLVLLILIYLLEKTEQVQMSKFFHESLNKDATEQAAGQVLNLEAGDSIKAQTEVANTVKGVISYALIDRSQENG
jgi:hypothetical protein